MRINYLISFLLFILLACNSPYPEGYEERFKAYETACQYCYDKRFHFPNDEKIVKDEYIQCKLDGQDILINNLTSGYEGTVRYESSWSTPSPNTSFAVDTGIQTRLHITFLAIEYWRQFSLVVDYPIDSLNYTIQHLFSQRELKLSSNFEDTYPQFFIGTICFPHDECNTISFNSNYSLQTNQIITIDRFEYKFHDGQWHYHLEYSFDEIELTNGAWNTRHKVDILGKQRDSEILIENILVRDMKCAIEFTLQPG